MAQNVALPARDTWQNVATVDRTAAAVAPTITTTALPDGSVDVAYSQTIQKTGTDPITFAVQSGTLPDGLTLSAQTGVVSGTPTTPVSASFTIRATNSAGYDDQAFTLLVPNSGSGGEAPIVTTVTLVPVSVSVENQATYDCIATVEDQNGDPVVNIDGTVISVNEATVTGTLTAPTDSNGVSTLTLTGESTGTTSVAVSFDNVVSNYITVTVAPAVVTGDSTITFDDMSLVAAGTAAAIPTVTGAANITFDTMTVSATGTSLISITGEASIELNRMRVAGTGVVGVDVGSASNYSVGGRYVSKPFYE